jgi:hypothetical protein
MQTIRVALTLLLLLLPSPVLAQDILGFAVSGGITIAAGDDGDTFEAGPNFSVRTVVPFSDRLALQTVIGFQQLRLRDDAVLLARGYDLATFRLGGGFVEGGDRQALQALVQGQLQLLSRSARISPYVLAGAGVAQIRNTDFGVYFLGEWEDEPGSSEITLTADAGAGLQIHLAGIVSAFAQGSYQMFFTDGGSTTMMPVQAGILVELGRQ